MNLVGRWNLLCMLLFSSLVFADIQQLLHEVPSCGLECVTSSVPKFDCSSSAPCICTSSLLSSSLSDCVAESCSIIDQLHILNITHLACGEPIKSRQAHLIGTAALGLVAWGIVNLRLYSRWKLGGAWNADDWIMVLADISLPPFMIVGCLAAGKGFGLNIYNITTINLVTALEIFFFGEIAYVLLLGLCKCSVLVFYMRVFPHTLLRRLCYLNLFWVFLSTILYQFLVLLQCLPLSYNWEGWKKDLGHPDRCLDLNVLAYSFAGVNIAQDLVILAIPLPWLVGINVKWREKAQIFFMFGVGIFITFCSIIRLTTLPSFKATKNPTWEFTDPMYWTAIEVYIAIIIPCLPALRLLLCHYLPRIFGTAGSSGGERERDWGMRRGDVGMGRHPYVRSESRGAGTSRSKGKSNSTRTWLARSGTRTGTANGGDGVLTRDGVAEWLELGDKRQGTVETVVAGNQNQDQNQDSEIAPSVSGIFVNVSTEISVEVRDEGNWLRDIELGIGGGASAEGSERSSWRTFVDGYR